MNPWRWVDPRVRSVQLAGVRSYLLGRGWLLSPNPNPSLLRFERPSDENGKPFFYMVPASDRFCDFAQSVAYLITTLSEIEDRHPVAILNDILQHQAGESSSLGVAEHPDSGSRTA
jgi:hypothetical protein